MRLSCSPPRPNPIYSAGRSCLSRTQPYQRGPWCACDGPLQRSPPVEHQTSA